MFFMFGLLLLFCSGFVGLLCLALGCCLALGLACVGIYLCLVCGGLARLFRLAWLLLVSIWCWFCWIWYFGCCTMVVVLIDRF